MHGKYQAAGECPACIYSGSAAVDAETVSSCLTDDPVMCRAGFTERSRRQPVADNTTKHRKQAE